MNRLLLIVIAVLVAGSVFAFPPTAPQVNPSASEAVSGHAELATNIETVTGTATDLITTPANITAKMAAPGTIGGTTPGDATFNDVTLSAAKHLLLPLHNDAATPTLAFGDGDTGFYENADDEISISIGGGVDFHIYANTLGGNNSGTAQILNTVSDATTPVHVIRGDINTGIGRAAADQLSLIAGGVEGIRITEDTTIAVDIKGTVTFNALYRRIPILAIASTAHPSNTPDTEIIGTYIGLGFDDDTDNALMTFEIPGDWDGVSDIDFRFYYTFAVAPANTETVKFDISYRARAETEDIDTGNATAGTVTQTILSALGETVVGYLFEDCITLTYNDGDNPLTAGDLIGISFDRDDAGDTENGEAIVILFELKYSANKHSQY